MRLPVTAILRALMTTTKSPQGICGVNVGLCLPRRICAISDARRPRTCPSASMMYHCGSRSAALALYVFIMCHLFASQNPLWICHPYQAQPMRWGRRTRVRYFSALRDSGKFVEAQPFLPYEQQCSNHPAYHSGQEGVRSKITIDKCILTLARSMEQGTHA